MLIQSLRSKEGHLICGYSSCRFSYRACAQRAQDPRGSWHTLPPSSRLPKCLHCGMVAAPWRQTDSMPRTLCGYARMGGCERSICTYRWYGVGGVDRV